MSASKNSMGTCCEVSVGRSEKTGADPRWGGEGKSCLMQTHTHTHTFKKGQQDNTKTKGEMYVRSLHFNLVLLFSFIAILEL